MMDSFNGDIALMRNRHGEWYLVMKMIPSGSGKYACYNINTGNISNKGDFKPIAGKGKQYWDMGDMLKRVLEIKSK